MHIYKMPNGRWRAVVQDEGRRRSKVAATEREAKRAGARLMIELGKEPDRTGQTVADLIDLHLNMSRRAKTLAADHDYLLAKIPAWLNEWKVEKVTAMMVDQAYHRLEADGWTVHRVRRLHEILRPAFDRAALWGWVSVNPVSVVKPPKAPETDIEIPAVSSIVDLVARATAFTPDLGCAILLTSRTGIRRGELCALQWDDIDEAKRTVHIRRSVTTTTGDAHHQRRGKIGQKGHRVIPVPVDVILALKGQRTLLATRALDRGHPLGSWVFTNDGREPWRTDYVTTAISRLYSEREHDARLAIHIHQLRHFAATQWIANGLDPKTVSYLLGHTRVATTLDVYAKYFQPNADEAADVMERLFNRA